MIFAIAQLTDGQALAALFIVIAAFCLLEGIHQVIESVRRLRNPRISRDG